MKKVEKSDLNRYKNVFTYFLGSVIALTSTQTMASSVKQVTPQQLAIFSQYAKKIQGDWQVPGMAVVIVQNNKIIYAKGFGERDVAGNPVTPETVFDIASMTKSFTAALLAKQIDAGKFQWNTSVLALDPEFKLYDAKATQAFEVRDLSAHDSGLTENTLDSLGNFGYSIESTLYSLRFIKPVAEFRSTFAYQDVFFEVAKKIIEKTSGESYGNNLQNDVFNPLHMPRTYLRTDPVLQTLTNVAQPFALSFQLKNYPYSKDSPYLTKMWALEPGVAGGGIDSTALDIGQWLIFNMNNGKKDGKQIISIKNMNYLHTPQTIVQKTANGKTTLAYGEGWFIDQESYQPYTMLYHAGGGTGSHAYMAYIPAEKIGIVTLTNQYTNKVPELLASKLFDLYFNKTSAVDESQIELQERNKQYAALAAAAANTKQCHNNLIKLDKYVGTYYNPVYGKIVLNHQENKLLMSIGPQKIQWELTPCSSQTFQAYWPNPNGMDMPMLFPGDDVVNFNLNKKNRVIKMTVPYLNDADEFIKLSSEVR